MTAPRLTTVATPVHDESIASLVARTARANSLSVNTLVASLGLPVAPSTGHSRGQRSGWVRSLFDPDDTTIAALSKVLRLDPAQVAWLTPARFARLESCLGHDLRPWAWTFRASWHGMTGWFHWGVTGYCPSCLDEQPNVSRFGWQVALQPLCVEHVELIHESCPTCLQPAAFQPLHSFNDGIPTCRRCRADLRTAARIDVPPDLAESGATLQRMLDAPDAYYLHLSEVTWLLREASDHARSAAVRRERGAPAPSQPPLSWTSPRRVETARNLPEAMRIAQSSQQHLPRASPVSTPST